MVLQAPLMPKAHISGKPGGTASPDGHGTVAHSPHALLGCGNAHAGASATEPASGLSHALAGAGGSQGPQRGGPAGGDPPTGVHRSTPTRGPQEQGTKRSDPRPGSHSLKTRGEPRPSTRRVREGPRPRSGENRPPPAPKWEWQTGKASRKTAFTCCGLSGSIC